MHSWIRAAAGAAVVTSLALSLPSIRAQAPRRVSSVEVTPPAGGSFYGLTPQFALSPDGRQVVYVANAAGQPPMLWLSSVPAGAARALAGTAQASYPFWSADSQFVGFFSGGKLEKISAAGGAPIVICDAPTGRGGTWNADGTIVFTSGISDPLRKVAASGGTPEVLTRLDTARENSHRWPVFLPDGRHILFWAGAGSAPPELKIASLDSGDLVSVVPADTNGTYASGHILYGQHNALMALPFDVATLKRTGEPIRVVAPLSGDAGSSVASLSAAGSGTVAYTQGEARGFVLSWLDRQGRPTGTVARPGQYTNAALSPDGSRVAVSWNVGTPPNRDVWVLDANSGAATRVTTDAGVDASPIFSADGNDVVYSSQRGGPYQMYRRRVHGDAPEELLLKSDVATIATDWSRDGRFVLYTRGTAATGLDVWALPLTGAHEPFPVVRGSGADDNAVFSPDGRWVAFQTNESGRNEIVVRPFSAPNSAAGAAAAIQVSEAGGTQPLWRGDEVFFFAPDGSVMAAAIRSSAAGLAAETPVKLFPAPVSLVIRRSYDVSSDGQRFIIPLLDENVRQTITIVPNWSGR
jgi:Tol biopolymer transport system component